MEVEKREEEETKAKQFSIRNYMEMGTSSFGEKVKGKERERQREEKRDSFFNITLEKSYIEK